MLIEDLKLYGLAFDCPYLDRWADCPSKHKEHLSFKEKMNWIDELSLDFKQNLGEKHKNWSKNRV